MIRPPPTSTLFPYTTLSRSGPGPEGVVLDLHVVRRPGLGADQLQRHRAALVQQHVGGDRHPVGVVDRDPRDRKSTRLNSSHRCISYAVFCLKKKKKR